MMIYGIFEIGMMLCFAAAWPFNITRAWRARTAVGTSPWFMLVIELGYILGMINKFVNDDVNYVFAFYVLDFVLVLIGLAIYARNKAIDRSRGRAPAE
ncbi:MAG: hypothetical protein ACI38Y_06200 [Candidatus Methanomethylophilaceae archaeon]